MNGNVPSALSTSMGMEKKPFTYLPGGIDFSELKSPKMQKRIHKHLQGNGLAADQTVSAPFGGVGGTASTPSTKHENAMRGSSLPRSMGSTTMMANTPYKKPEFKKQGSISDLLSFTDPDPPPATMFQSKPQAEPYNPYAKKKPSNDDSVIEYNNGVRVQQQEKQANPASATKAAMHATPFVQASQKSNGQENLPRPPINNVMQSHLVNSTPNLSGMMTPPLPPSKPPSGTMTPPPPPPPKPPSGIMTPPPKPPVGTMTPPPLAPPKPNQVCPPPPPAPPKPPSGVIPPPPPPPPPSADADPFNMSAPKMKASKVNQVHAQLQHEKMQKLEEERLERERLEELERQRQEALERQRQEEERRRQEEERKRLEEERKRQEEERKRIEDERHRQEELERQRQMELEKQRQEELQRQRQLEMEWQRQEEEKRQTQKELDLYNQQQEEIRMLEELQQQKLDELWRLKEEEKLREHQIKQLKSQTSIEEEKRREFEQYMQEEMQRQEAMSDVQQGQTTGQLTPKRASSDVPDQSKKFDATFIPYFIPRDKMEPMELYEEMPSEQEMGVSGFEIDRSRFKEKVRPKPPLPPPSPTKLKRGRGYQSPKLMEQQRMKQEEELIRKAQEQDKKRREVEEQRKIIEDNQRKIDEIKHQQRLEQENLRRQAEEEKQRQEEEQRRQYEEQQRQYLEMQRIEEERIRRAHEEEKLRKAQEEERLRREAEEARIRQAQEDERLWRAQQEEKRLEEMRRQEEELRWQQSRIPDHDPFAMQPRVDLLNRPFFSPPVLMPSNPMFSSDFFKADPFNHQQIMTEPSHQNQRISPQGVKDGSSRIIPIQVEKGKNAFSNQTNNEASKVREVPISINNLNDLKHHQRQNNAEDSIRGYSKPQAKPKAESGSGFDDVMKAMKSNPTFSQRERNSSLHSVESVPSSPATVQVTGTFQPPPLKHVRQHSLPDSVGPQHLRRSSEPEAILQTRKNVASELDSNMGDPKNRKPSNMFGPRKTPSQSPYMRLLSRALSQSSNEGDGGNGEFEEGQVVSKEYKGEQGRYMPPKHGKPAKFQEDEV
eukprot:02070.XXX_29100_32832_1 [CDS] Oithona nana genome sequencing.